MAAALSGSYDYELEVGSTTPLEQSSGVRHVSLRSLHSLPSPPPQYSVPPSPASYGQHAPSEDSELRLELVCESLQRLGQQVRCNEDQQLAHQRQMVRLESTLQGLQEEQVLRTSRTSMDGYMDSLAARLDAAERTQTALAAGAQRALRLALKTAEAQKVLTDRQDEEHGRFVHECDKVRTNLAKLEDQLQNVAPSTEVKGFSTRLAQQEAAQKRLEQRMKQFEAEELEGRFAKLEAVTAELRTQWKDCSAKQASEKQAADLEPLQGRLDQLEVALAEQDKRTRSCLGQATQQAEQLKELDIALAEMQSTSAAEALFGGSATSSKIVVPDDPAEPGSDLFEGLAERAKSQAAALASLEERFATAGVQELRQEFEELRSSLRAPEPEAEAPIAEGARPEPRAVAELRARLEDLAELMDEQGLAQTRQVASLVPELKAHVERLGMQCAQCTAKTEGLEVRLDLTRTNLDTQEQRLQAVSERVEKSLARLSSPPPTSGMPCVLQGEKSALHPKAKQVQFAPMATVPPELPTLLSKMTEPSFSLQSTKVSQKLDELCAKLPIPSTTRKEALAKKEETEKSQACQSEASQPQDVRSCGLLEKAPVEKTPPASPVWRSISHFTGC